ncbi:MAG TPA: hypothetical protein VGM56_04330 [Byssovorax sp.]
MARAQHDPRAVELFKQSAARYRDGRFAEAAALLREAYAREPEPLLLFNLGRACEGMGDAPCAIDAYTRYLAAKAPADRGAIESRVATLKRQVEEKELLEQRAAEAAARATPSPATPARASVAPWIVAGVGGVGLAVALGLGIAASEEHQSALDDPVQKTKLASQADAKSLATATNAVLVAGGLVAAAGVTWGVIDLLTRRGATSAPTRAAPRATLVPLLGGAAVVGRF